MAACGSTSEQVSSEPHPNQANCRRIDHDAGTTEICGTPQTISVLGPNALDLLLSLEEQPDAYADVFVTHSGKVFDNPGVQIPYLGDRITTQPVNLGHRDQPSLETLYALQPDLILGEMGGAGATYDAMSRTAPTILWDQRNRAEKWRVVLGWIAQALGDEARAERAIATHEAQVQQARAALAPVAATYPQVLLLGAKNVNESLGVIEPESYLGELFEGLGFELISVPTQFNTVDISVEMLPEIAANADTIFILGHDLSAGDEAQRDSSTPVLDRALDRQTAIAKQSWEGSAIAQSLPASQQNRVFFTTYYLWNGLNGPIGAELTIQQLQQFLL